MTGITVISNETKLFTHDFDVIQAFQSDFCVINFVQLLILLELGNKTITKLDKGHHEKNLPVNNSLIDYPVKRQQFSVLDTASLLEI
jgi:hypothetical protein